MTYKAKQGIAAPVIVIILAILAIIGGSVYYGKKAKTPDKENDEKQMMVEDKMEEKGGTMMEKGGEVMMEGPMMESDYKGTVLAGISAPFLEFNKEDYERALKSKKVILLYFYAKWCPICLAEIPEVYAAFDELTSDDAVGFRVNYDDQDTDTHEKALAKEFNVTYQHTKVILQSGKPFGPRHPDSWKTARYLSEINKALQ